ncbi:MAG TPA: hypothetical protein VF054_13660 [Micromonosporaceae bacterium]
MSLSIAQTVLIFVGIPLAVVLIVVGLVYLGGPRRGKRYRPGRPYEFAPVWFLAGSEQVTPGHTAIARHTPVALPAPETGGDHWPGEVAVQHGETGGASDRW